MNAVRSSAYHHVALRVADLDRSTRFYRDVFGGESVIELELDAGFVESIFAAPPGTRGLNRVISFGDWAIELFQFVPSLPVNPTEQYKAGLMHLCVRVGDVAGTVEAIRRAGGGSEFPIRPWGGHHFVYATDPDGHVIELLDATVEQCRALVASVGLPDHNREAGGETGADTASPAAARTPG